MEPHDFLSTIKTWKDNRLHNHIIHTYGRKEQTQKRRDKKTIAKTCYEIRSYETREHKSLKPYYKQEKKMQILNIAI